MRGLFVTGTDTGAGKTVLCAALAARLRAEGRRVAASKPVVTGLDDPPPAGWAHDHEILARAAGSTPEIVSPHRFGPAVSPHLAAELAGADLALDALRAAVDAAAARADAVLVEGVGGLLAPLTARDSVRDLAVALGLPLLVAARPGLGTINHTLLTLEAARAAGLAVRAVVMTPWPEAPDAIAHSNRETVAARGGVAVEVLPAAVGPEPEALAAASARLPLAAWLVDG